MLRRLCIAGAPLGKLLVLLLKINLFIPIPIPYTITDFRGLLASYQVVGVKGVSKSGVRSVEAGGEN